ncbi:hypothetical protein HYU40_00945 [Candidatus Woesearchaeota archaeon]|nr:hypothetical protein [Candidatus Woesearchaeota archaeon]
MQKGVIVLALLALALAVAGCQGGGKTVSSSSTPFIGGSEGLRVSFVENAPPTEVLDNPKPADKTQVQKFDVILRVENVGEQDVAAGSIKTTIGGIYPADFDKTNADLQNVLFSVKRPGVATVTGVKKDPEGDKLPGSIEELTFKDLAYIKQLEGNNEFPIQADVCYKYTTKAVGDFCMRADLTRTQGGVCQAKGTKPVFSSGSPVQVTSVDESIGGRNKVILKFKIKTLGSGSFFKPDALGTAGTPNCVRGDFSKENFVKVTVNSGVAGLTCSGFTSNNAQSATGDVRLSNGEGTITCIQDGINVDAVQKANLQIEYHHLISASTKLLVKHLPGFEATPTAGGNIVAADSSAPAPPPVPTKK